MKSKAHLTVVATCKAMIRGRHAQTTAKKISALHEFTLAPNVNKPLCFARRWKERTHALPFHDSIYDWEQCNATQRLEREALAVMKYREFSVYYHRNGTLRIFVATWSCFNST